MSKAKDRSDLKPHKTGMSEQAKFNSERTRKSNKFIKSESLKTTLSGEDLRNSGTLNHHLAQLADLRHKLEDENE